MPTTVETTRQRRHDGAVSRMVVRRGDRKSSKFGCRRCWQVPAGYVNAEESSTRRSPNSESIALALDVDGKVGDSSPGSKSAKILGASSCTWLVGLTGAMRSHTGHSTVSLEGCRTNMIFSLAAQSTAFYQVWSGGLNSCLPSRTFYHLPDVRRKFRGFILVHTTQLVVLSKSIFSGSGTLELCSLA